MKQYKTFVRIICCTYNARCYVLGIVTFLRTTSLKLFG